MGFERAKPFKCRSISTLYDSLISSKFLEFQGDSLSNINSATSVWLGLLSSSATFLISKRMDFVWASWLSSPFDPSPRCFVCEELIRSEFKIKIAKLILLPTSLFRSSLSYVIFYLRASKNPSNSCAVYCINTVRLRYKGQNPNSHLTIS